MTRAFDSEQSFVQWIEHLVDQNTNLLGHNEDAVAIKISTNEYMVLNIDGWVASTDLPPGIDLFQAGYRAVANSLSDVIAKGAKPEGMIISVSLSDNYQSQLQDLLNGFSQASKDFSTFYLGGDMNSSTDLVIDVTAWGKCNHLIKRAGANIGDIVYWLGPDLGCTAAALGILIKQWSGDRNMAIEVMGHPQLFPEFLDISSTAATDSSDGLARSLYHISTASKVAIELYDFQTIGQSIPQWIREVSQMNQVDLLDLILFGGEELGIVFTANSKTNVPNTAFPIGTVSEGSGVRISGELIENKGWDHFS